MTADARCSSGYGDSVKVPVAGQVGASRAVALPGHACDWYQRAGVVVMRG